MNQPTAKQMRVAIAEVCGRTEVYLDEDDGNQPYGIPPGGLPKNPGFATIAVCVPNYPASLDAMHEAEKVLTPTQQAAYYGELYRLLHQGHYSIRYQQWIPVITATAHQRATAFLRVTRPEMFKE